MILNRRQLHCAFLSVAACLPGFFLGAATYLPMSDADLAGRAPVIVRASVAWAAWQCLSPSGIAFDASGVATVPGRHGELPFLKRPRPRFENSSICS